MVPLVVEAAEQRKGPAAAGAQIPPSDYRVRKVRFLPSANTNAGREMVPWRQSLPIKEGPRAQSGGASFFREAPAALSVPITLCFNEGSRSPVLTPFRGGALVCAELF
jgi:hypothetical protein